MSAYKFSPPWETALRVKPHGAEFIVGTCAVVARIAAADATPARYRVVRIILAMLISLLA